MFIGHLYWKTKENSTVLWDLSVFNIIRLKHHFSGVYFFFTKQTESNWDLKTSTHARIHFFSDWWERERGGGSLKCNYIRHSPDCYRRFYFLNFTKRDLTNIDVHYTDTFISYFNTCSIGSEFQINETTI